MVKKIVRMLGWVVGLALSVIVVTIVSIIWFVDPNDFKDDITQAVHDATGRELLLQGDIQLSLFPWLGLSLGEAQLSNAAGFEDKIFARVEAVDIKAKLLPLLQQRIEMKTLRLHGLQVNLSRAADGRTNWDDLVTSSTAAPASVESDAPTASRQPSTPTAQSVSPLATLAIGGVNIEAAQVHWDDRQADQHIEIDRFDVQTGPIAMRKPIDVQLSAQLSLSAPALQTPVKLKARLTLDPEAQRYRVDGLDIAVNARSDVLPVSPLNAGLTGNIDANLARQKVLLSDLQIKALSLTAKAKLELQDVLTTPQANGELRVSSFSPRDLLKTLAIAPPETADAKVLGKAAIKMAFTGSPDAVSVNKLELVLDDSKLTGSVSVKNFIKPAVRYELNLDDIDVDRYLSPVTEAAAPAPSPTAAVAASTQLPFDMLRGLDVQGDLRAGKVKVAKARLSEIALGVKAKNGEIRVSPVQAKLYQGTYSGSIMLDVRKDTPLLSADEKLNAIHVGPLLKDVLGDDKVSGVANLSAKITASGISPEEITKSLNGSAKFRFSDGAVKGVNLGQMIREAYAKIKNKPAPPKSNNATDFAEMSGSVNIRNGVVHNQDLKAKSPLLRIAGKGQVDLPKQRINYLLNASIVETDQGQAGKELAELKALTIPVKVTGTFDKPKFALDLEPVLKAKAEAEIKRQKKKLKKKAEKKLEKKKDEVKKRLEDKLKEKFKGLF